jgi:hypothetical protein
VEIELGVDYLNDSPPNEMPEAQLPGDQLPGRRRNKGAGGKKNLAPAMSLATIPPRGLLPVGPWAKYAHALLQANEAMFIN